MGDVKICPFMSSKGEAQYCIKYNCAIYNKNYDICSIALSATLDLKAAEDDVKNSENRNITQKNIYSLCKQVEDMHTTINNIETNIITLVANSL